jgi:hypothetical protein
MAKASEAVATVLLSRWRHAESMRAIPTSRHAVDPTRTTSPTKQM